ncbi:MAG: carboxymuconolactone decarboxylase family protein [bacterium]|nr:carboxymuconolactone decarboxylase family protein [bacterium]
MATFGKRTYRNPLEFLKDMGFVVTHLPSIFRMMVRGGVVEPKFRERLMLAVTKVNRCSYCTYVHAKIALKEGMNSAEIEALLADDLGDVPEAERTAVLYAQHWAETEGMTDPEVRAKLEAEYGADTARLLHLPLRLVRIGNYMGNFMELVGHTVSLRRFRKSWRYDEQ